MNKVKIDKLDHYGRGIAKINNKITFIENALPEEEVEIKVLKEKKSYNEAEVVKYISENKKRNKYECPYYNICGGCNIGHLKYLDQLKFKVEKVKNIFEKYNNIKINPNIIESNNYSYRNKVVLHVKDNKIGYYKQNTNTLIEIDNCLLLSKKVNNIITILRQIDLSNIYKIMIRETLNEIMLVLYGKLGDKENVLNKLKDKVTTIITYDNKYNILYGNGVIYEKINEIDYIISPESFFQVNTKQMIKLYDKILDYLDINKNDKILDLYCGVGSIGIYISSYVKEVLGIEINESAIKDANINKKINNIKNIKFICSDVSDVIDDIKGYNKIIIDPPRKGLDKHTKDILLKLKPEKIVYVSCDPITLARDIKDLNELYELKNIELVDMFPNTYHVESVVELNLK